ncbi:FRG domain protein [Pirellulimonas nuda]|uniref:FRG domain protein n=2 Tax=Pirellulimonas nuda TaxID=2528009 RepID=A0A518D7F6_9BACT|nr:FRG domain protein [Pirellulimonas nuda]
MKEELSRALMTIVLDTAEEFVDAILPTGPYFRMFAPSEWLLFRGVSRESYKLIPSALRSLAAAQGSGGNAGIPGTDHWKEVIRREARSISQFFRNLDAGGLPVPGDCNAIRNYLHEYSQDGLLERDFEEGLIEWPPTELLPLMGVAQHHGLPTRMLDWTRSAMVAGYFAAFSAAQRNKLGQPHGDRESDNRFSVWWFSPPTLGLDSRSSTHGGGSFRRLRIVTTPAALNPNLQAQNGVFTVLTQRREHLDGVVDATPLHIALEDHPTCRQIRLFTRISAPSTEAGKVLWLLAKHDIRARSIFPGLDGAARDVIESSLRKDAYIEGVLRQIADSKDSRSQ